MIWHHQKIQPGDYTPYIPGLDTALAEVLGTCRDGEQYVLMIQYYKQDDETGELVLVKEIFQRDRKLIDGFWADFHAGGIWHYRYASIPALA